MVYLSLPRAIFIGMGNHEELLIPNMSTLALQYPNTLT